MNYRKLTREEEHGLHERDRLYAAIYFYARLADVPLSDEAGLEKGRRAVRRAMARVRKTPKCHYQDTLPPPLP